MGYIGYVERKPIFGVCDQVTLEPACLATETSYKLKSFTGNTCRCCMLQKTNIKGADQTAQIGLCVLFAHNKVRFPRIEANLRYKFYFWNVHGIHDQ